ncbi:MAG: hypothetical protein AB7K71_33060 [Polyangiaceae bacterium]
MKTRIWMTPIIGLACFSLTFGGACGDDATDGGNSNNGSGGGNDAGSDASGDSATNGDSATTSCNPACTQGQECMEGVCVGASAQYGNCLVADCPAGEQPYQVGTPEAEYCVCAPGCDGTTGSCPMTSAAPTDCVVPIDDPEQPTHCGIPCPGPEDPREPSDACPSGMTCVQLEPAAQAICMYSELTETKTPLGESCAHSASSCVEGTQCIQAIPLDVPRCFAICDDSASPLCSNGQTCIPTTTGLGACQFGGQIGMLGIGAECEFDASCTKGAACRKDPGESLGKCAVVCEVNSPDCLTGETCVPSDIWANNVGGFCTP